MSKRQRGLGFRVVKKATVLLITGAFFLLQAGLPLAAEISPDLQETAGNKNYGSVEEEISDPAAAKINSDSKEEYVAGEILVKFKPEISPEEVKIITEEYDSSVVKAIKAVDIYHLKIPADKTVLKMVDIFQKDPRVKYAEPNYVYEMLGKGWITIIRETMGRIKREMQATIQIGNLDSPDSNAPIVAVIDTGIDYDHFALDQNIWTNEDEIPGNGIDDDGNGYIDDTNGWDFADENNDPMGTSTHGTHVSGIVNRVANGNVQIMALQRGRVFNEADIIEAIIYAADNGADVINMSFGNYRYSQGIQDAINYAHEEGVVIIAAAGNDGSMDSKYPAAYDHVISVGAIDDQAGMNDFSNFGPLVDVYAPGENILSTVPDDQLALESGTSMAAPYVAGLAARIKAKNPLLPPDEVSSLIINNANQPVQANNNWLQGIWGKILQALFKQGARILGQGVNVDRTLAATPTIGKTISEIFRQELGRDPTQEELTYWSDEAENGTSRKEIVSAIDSSPNAAYAKQTEEVKTKETQTKESKTIIAMPEIKNKSWKSRAFRFIPSQTYRGKIGYYSSMRGIFGR